MADLAQQMIAHLEAALNSDRIQTEVIEPAGQEAVRLLRRNTSEGRGFGDDDFGSYAPSTQKRKKRSRPVTFRETGATMDGLFSEARKPNQGAVMFTHHNVVMEYHQRGEGRNPKREIFPDNPDQNSATIAEFTAFIEARLTGLLNATS